MVTRFYREGAFSRRSPQANQFHVTSIAKK
jgi:hypothetical protein